MVYPALQGFDRNAGIIAARTEIHTKAMAAKGHVAPWRQLFTRGMGLWGLAALLFDATGAAIHFLGKAAVFSWNCARIVKLEGSKAKNINLDGFFGAFYIVDNK